VPSGQRDTTTASIARLGLDVYCEFAVSAPVEMKPSSWLRSQTVQRAIKDGIKIPSGGTTSGTLLSTGL
jgi:hypothetical protein